MYQNINVSKINTAKKHLIFKKKIFDKKMKYIYQMEAYKLLLQCIKLYLSA